MLLKKLENYGTNCMNFAWFRTSLTNWKQYNQITNDGKSDVRNITHGVPQGSLFLNDLLVYVNDLPSSSKMLNPIRLQTIQISFMSTKILLIFLPQ